MRSVRGVVLVLLFCMFIGVLAGQSSAQTYFTQTATGGTLGAESGNFGNVTLTLITSGTEGAATCSVSDACIEVQLDATANSNWNLFNQNGVGLVAFVLPTGVSVYNCSVATCGLNTNIGYDGLGTYSYSLYDTNGGTGLVCNNGTPGCSSPGPIGNIITGNALTFYLQDSTSNLSLSSFGLPTGTTSLNPVSPFGLNICAPDTSGAGNGCEELTSGSKAGNIAHAYAAITPEPASCLLFGTGLLSFAGMLRRRKFTV